MIFKVWKRAAPAGRVAFAIWFAVFWLLVFARLEFRASFFPPYYWGEEAQILDATSSMDASIKAGTPCVSVFVGSSLEYNKGYSWAAFPLFEWAGYDIRIVTLLVPFCVSLACAGFFLLYQKSKPKQNILTGVLVAVAMALFCVSVRRYKWHTISYFSCLSVYAFFWPYIFASTSRNICKWMRIIAGAALIVSCFFYFGNIIYFVPIAFLSFILDLRFMPRRIMIYLACSIPLLALSYLIFLKSALWKNRVEVSLSEVSKICTQQVFALRLGTIHELICDYFTWPYVVLLCLGLAISVYKIAHRDRFALINFCLLAWTFVIQFLIEGLNNPDWMNWSMIPIFGLLLIAVTESIEWLEGWNRVFALAAIFAFLAAGLHEFLNYPWLNAHARHQAHAYPYDTTAQASLVLRLIAEDRSKDTVYFLPAADVAEAQGGFKYDVNAKRKDFQALWPRINFISDIKNAESIARRDVPASKQAILFLSVPAVSLAEETSSISGEADLFSIIFPFEEVYMIKYPIRKVRLR